MKSRRALITLGGSLTTLFIAGCAVPKRATGQNPSNSLLRRGRLSIRVQAAPDQGLTRDQSFSAAFELLGDPEHGELLFYTPLGSTAADIRWEPGNAVLQTQGETRHFSDLSQLIQVVLGTDVPVDALFAWMAGQTREIRGWQVDLSQQAQGKILARRVSPSPQAELRMILEN